LGHWVIGSLGHWVIGSLGHWVIGMIIMFIGIIYRLFFLEYHLFLD